MRRLYSLMSALSPKEELKLIPYEPGLEIVPKFVTVPLVFPARDTPAIPPDILALVEPGPPLVMSPPASKKIPRLLTRDRAEIRYGFGRHL